MMSNPEFRAVAEAFRNEVINIQPQLGLISQREQQQILASINKFLHRDADIQAFQSAKDALEKGRIELMAERRKFNEEYYNFRCEQADVDLAKRAYRLDKEDEAQGSVESAASTDVINQAFQRLEVRLGAQVEQNTRDILELKRICNRFPEDNPAELDGRQSALPNNKIAMPTVKTSAKKVLATPSDFKAALEELKTRSASFDHGRS